MHGRYGTQVAPWRVCGLVVQLDRAFGQRNFERMVDSADVGVHSVRDQRL